MLSVLTETQRAIVETVSMGLHVVQALEYLKYCGYEMSRAKYFRQKKKIENMKMERMRHIPLYFQDQHMDRIDKCETVEKLMWKNYHEEKSPSKRVTILGEIIGMQSWLAGYYDATRFVLERRVKTEADLLKTHNPYISINVRSIREKELEEEAEQRRFAINREREEQSRLEVSKEPTPIVWDNDNKKIIYDNEPSPVNSSPVEEHIEEEPETEAERYWREPPVRRRVV
jgi:hypothetical protein